jgi:hypothetical protein
MTELRPRVAITYTCTLVLSESEMRALDALAGYGDDAFLKAFYKDLGTHYLKPHEAGLRSLFAAIRHDGHLQLADIDLSRTVIAEAMKPKPAPVGKAPSGPPGDAHQGESR